MNASLTEWVHALYENNAEKLYKIAFYRLGGNAELAQDIVQDTFLTLIAKADKVFGYDCPEAWLMQTLNYNILHACQVGARNMKKEFPIEPYENLLQHCDESLGIDELLPPGFPESDRNLLKMYYEERLSYEEIAQVLHISPLTVGTRLYRLKQKLKKILSKSK